MGKNGWKWKEIEPHHYLAVNTCKLCGKEYNNGNVMASLYCPECAARIKREKTAERVKRYRAKKKSEAPAE